MTVVSFVDYQPLARYDGNPWTKALIYESVSADGPWVLIETKTFADPDADPTNPKVRNFTTELATLVEGWYYVEFEDATGDKSPTEPIHNVQDPAAGFLPLVSDVGAILRARTKDSNGNELGTFTTTTRPTFNQVQILISDAARDVTGLVDYDIPEESYPQARSVIALGAALLVELSYFPEQVASNRSPYDQLKALYDERLERLLTAVTREQAEDATGDETSAGSVHYAFPPVTNYLDKVM